MYIVASKSNFRQIATYALLPGQRRYDKSVGKIYLFVFFY